MGHNGDFDTLASSVIRREISSNDYGNASLILVLPYQTAEYLNNADSFKAYYNEVELCEKSADAHFRAAIQIRNRYMIDRSDLVVCYVERTVGGAYSSALRYAEKNKIPYINLALSDVWSDLYRSYISVSNLTKKTKSVTNAVTKCKLNPWFFWQAVI